MTEHGYAVAARSTLSIADAAESFLRTHAPEHLRSGTALDLTSLVDRGLQKERIAVYPVRVDELPRAEAETRAGSGEWIEIWMREEFFQALFERSSSTVRARSTLSHEIGHALLHRAELRSGRSRPHSLALKRAPRSELKPYQDSEWQAHTFAGALLLPLTALRRCDRDDTWSLAQRFDVSEAFARSHLGRVSKLL